MVADAFIAHVAVDVLAAAILLPCSLFALEVGLILTRCGAAARELGCHDRTLCARLAPPSHRLRRPAATPVRRRNKSGEFPNSTPWFPRPSPAAAAAEAEPAAAPAT